MDSLGHKMFGTQHTKKSVVRRGIKQERNIKPFSLILCDTFFRNKQLSRLKVKIFILISELLFVLDCEDC